MGWGGMQGPGLRGPEGRDGGGRRDQVSGDPRDGMGGRAGALTCGDGQLSIDLVHKHLPAGLDHDDLEKQSWLHALTAPAAPGS